MRIITSLLLFFSTILFYGQNSPVLDKKDTSEEEKAIRKLLDSSTANYYKGNLIASLKYNTEIIDRALAINNAELISKGYRYLAYDYLTICDTILAKENFDNAQKYAELTENGIALGKTYMDLGNLYSVSNDDEKAYVYYEKSIDAFKKAKDTLSLTNVYYNMAFILFYDKKYERATTLLKKLENPDFNKFLDESTKNTIGKGWAIYFLEYKKDYEKANMYASKVISFAKENQHYEDLETLYDILSRSHYEQKKYKKAADYSRLVNELQEKNAENRKKAFSKSETVKFQIEQYKKDLVNAEEKSKLQEEINKNTTKLINILIGVCIMGFTLIIFLLIAYRKRKLLNKKLREKNIKYLEAKQKAEHLSKAKSKFFSTISHELRTPLYGVIGLSTIFLEDPKLESHKKDIESLKFSADYLLALINDVLQINKIESKRLEEEQINFDLKHLLSSITTSFEYMRLQNKNKFHVNIDSEIPEIISGSSIRISQILMNLIGNACKFTENGDIYIQAKKEKIADNKVTIYFSIKDTGIGIPKEKQEIIFDEFSQVENLSSGYQGTGLGLPIVKKLLALSNSEIHIESETGKGSTFSFYLDFMIPTEKVTAEEIAMIDESALENKKSVNCRRQPH